MALIDDVVTLALLASAMFFVALSFGLLLRYRQISQKISASSDLGHDLWLALEQRMKKQDERILDMMGRLEVVQSRVMAAAAAQGPVPTPSSPTSQPIAKLPEETGDEVSPDAVAQPPRSQGESQASQPQPEAAPLDETQFAAMKLLLDGPKNTRQLTDALGKSREHTARLMKELFQLGLVVRNDSTKPFVYRLTDVGKSRLG